MIPSTSTLQKFLYQVVWLLASGAICWACESKEMKEVLMHCSPHLGSVHTSILRTTDRNFTATCSEYVEYVLCIETQMREMCPTSMKRDGPLYKDFVDTKLIYQAKPYNCTLPDYVLVMEYNLGLNTVIITTTPPSGGSANLFASWLHSAVCVICAVLSWVGFPSILTACLMDVT